MVEKAELKSVRCLGPAGSECTAASSRDRGKQASNGSDEESNGSDEESDGSDDSERLVAIMQALERKWVCAPLSCSGCNLGYLVTVAVT
jgi:hypothetical protein